MNRVRATAIGDQLHAEVTDRARQMIREMTTEDDIPLTEDEEAASEIGITAGFMAAIKVVAERGWLRVEL